VMTFSPHLTEWFSISAKYRYTTDLLPLGVARRIGNTELFKINSVCIIRLGGRFWVFFVEMSSFAVTDRTPEAPSTSKKKSDDQMRSNLSSGYLLGST